jgi:glutathione reductase (NADPH)
MKDIYDLVVIGSGTAAQVASARVHGAGWRVAVIDHRPFGGTCALRGCDPKKMLISGAEAIDAASRMRGHGVSGDLRIEWRDLIAFKRSFTDPVPHKVEEHLTRSGIEVFHGRARFAGRDTIAVGDRELTARYILVAAGAEPVPLHIPGEEHIITSERFLELEALPARILFVGGGYIAAEFSHLAARAGSRVVVLQRAERMLPAFDADLVGLLMTRFDDLQIEVHTRSTVREVRRIGDAFVVHASTVGQTQTVATDLIVHAAGRAPDFEALGLAVAGLEVENGRLKLNRFLQSVSNPRVYAAGDAARRGPALTPVASHEGKVAARNLLEGNTYAPDYRGVPSVAFTIPPIAAVGLREEEARARGLKVRVNSASVPDWYTARRLNERVYGFKTLVDEGTERVLGAHLVGPHAEEVINLFGLAIRYGVTTEDLKQTIFAYPTGASDIGYMV